MGFFVGKSPPQNDEMDSSSPAAPQNDECGVGAHVRCFAPHTLVILSGSEGSVKIKG